MAKWVDYVTTAVRSDGTYDQIIKVKVVENIGETLHLPSEMTRQTVNSNIDEGRTFVTTQKNKEGKWNIGVKVIKVQINSFYYIKTVSNYSEKDNLREFPEFKKSVK